MTALNRSRWVLAGLATALTLGAGAAVAANAGDSEKYWRDPWRGMSDADKQATVSAAHEANRVWFEEFMQSREDPRSLPAFLIEGYAPLYDSLGAVVAAADVVVLARVEAQSFSLAGDSILPHSSARLRVIEGIRGSEDAGSQITVVQAGGPLRTSVDGRGSLAQLTGSPLLLAGDVVILAAARSEEGTLRALPGLGVHFTSGDRVAGTGTDVSSPLVGLALGEAITRIAAAAP